MTRFGLRTTALAALAMGLSLGGPLARADLQLSVSDPLAMISIDNTATSATSTLTANTAGTYTYSINGVATTFVIATNGGSATVTGVGSLSLVSFAADGTTNSGLSAFDSYQKLSITSTPTTNSFGSTLQDINTDATASTAGGANLTITASNPFAGPSGDIIATSGLSSAGGGGFQGGTVTFQSTVNGTNIPTTPLSQTSTSSIALNGFNISSSTFLTNVTSPVSTSNQLTLTGLGAGLSDSFTASTNISAVPEPSTIATAMIGMALVGGYRLRRRAK